MMVDFIQDELKFLNALKLEKRFSKKWILDSYFNLSRKRKENIIQEEWVNLCQQTSTIDKENTLGYDAILSCFSVHYLMYIVEPYFRLGRIHQKDKKCDYKTSANNEETLIFYTFHDSLLKNTYIYQILCKEINDDGKKKTSTDLRTIAEDYATFLITFTQNTVRFLVKDDDLSKKQAPYLLYFSSLALGILRSVRSCLQCSSLAIENMQYQIARKCIDNQMLGTSRIHLAAINASVWSHVSITPPKTEWIVFPDPSKDFLKEMAQLILGSLYCYACIDYEAHNFKNVYNILHFQMWNWCQCFRKKGVADKYDDKVFRLLWKTASLSEKTITNENDLLLCLELRSLALKYFLNGIHFKLEYYIQQLFRCGVQVEKLLKTCNLESFQQLVDFYDNGLKALDEKSSQHHGKGILHLKLLPNSLHLEYLMLMEHFCGTCYRSNQLTHALKLSSLAIDYMNECKQSKETILTHGLTLNIWMAIFLSLQTNILSDTSLQHALVPIRKCLDELSFLMENTTDTDMKLSYDLLRRLERWLKCVFKLQISYEKEMDEYFLDILIQGYISLLHTCKYCCILGKINGAIELKNYLTTGSKIGRALMKLASDSHDYMESRIVKLMDSIELVLSFLHEFDSSLYVSDLQHRGIEVYALGLNYYKQQFYRKAFYPLKHSCKLLERWIEYQLNQNLSADQINNVLMEIKLDTRYSALASCAIESGLIKEEMNARFKTLLYYPTYTTNFPFSMVQNILITQTKFIGLSNDPLFDDDFDGWILTYENEWIFLLNQLKMQRNWYEMEWIMMVLGILYTFDVYVNSLMSNIRGSNFTSNKENLFYMKSIQVISNIEKKIINFISTDKKLKSNSIMKENLQIWITFLQKRRHDLINMYMNQQCDDIADHLEDSYNKLKNNLKVGKDDIKFTNEEEMIQSFLYARNISLKTIFYLEYQIALGYTHQLSRFELSLNQFKEFLYEAYQAWQKVCIGLRKFQNFDVLLVMTNYSCIQMINIFRVYGYQFEEINLLDELKSTYEIFKNKTSEYQVIKLESSILQLQNCAIHEIDNNFLLKSIIASSNKNTVKQIETLCKCQHIILRNLKNLNNSDYHKCINELESNINTLQYWDPLHCFNKILYLLHQSTIHHILIKSLYHLGKRNLVYNYCTRWILSCRKNLNYYGPEQLYLPEKKILNSFQNLTTSNISSHYTNQLNIQIWENEGWIIASSFLNSLLASSFLYSRYGHLSKSLYYLSIASKVVDRLEIVSFKNMVYLGKIEILIQCHDWNQAQELLEKISVASYTNEKVSILLDVKRLNLEGMLFYHRRCFQSAMKLYDDANEILMKFFMHFVPKKNLIQKKKFQSIVELLHGINQFNVEDSIKTLIIFTWKNIAECHIQMLEKSESCCLVKDLKKIEDWISLHEKIEKSQIIKAEANLLYGEVYWKAKKNSKEQTLYLDKCISFLLNSYHIATILQIPSIIKRSCRILTIALREKKHAIESFMIFHESFGILTRLQMNSKEKEIEIDESIDKLSMGLKELNIEEKKTCDMLQDLCKKYKQIQSFLPNTYHLVGVCVIENDLIITRLQIGKPPVYICIKEMATQLYSTIQSFDKIIAESRETLSGDSMIHANKWSSKQKREWWDKRERLDRQIECIVSSLESHCLGVWKCLFLPTYKDNIQEKKISKIAEEILKKIDLYTEAHSTGISNLLDEDIELLNVLLNAYPVLSNDEFQQGLQYILTSKGIKDSSFENEILFHVKTCKVFQNNDEFKDETIIQSISIESIEKLKVKELKDQLTSHGLSTSGLKADLIHRLKCFMEKCDDGKKKRNSISKSRHHLLLLLGEQLLHFPWEGLPCLLDCSISRVPSLDTIIKLTHSKHKVDPSKCRYILNPGGDLKETQTSFENFFQSNTKRYGWKGMTNSAPTVEIFEDYLKSSSLFIYCGHGSGEKYLSREKIEKLYHSPSSILLGCSSGRLKQEGLFEAQGPALSYIIGGSISVVALLWDVTDKDIDRLSLPLLNQWMERGHQKAVSEILPECRKFCKFPFLTGLAPISFGLPLYLEA